MKKRKRRENKYKANKLKLFIKHQMKLCVVWNSAEPKKQNKTKTKKNIPLGIDVCSTIKSLQVIPLINCTKGN